MARRSSTSQKNSGPKLLEDFVKRALDLAKKAHRQQRSLTGENYYANKLVELRADATNVFEDMVALSPGDTSAMAEMIETVFSPKTDRKRRQETARELVFSLRTTWRQPSIPIQVTPDDNIVPLSILDKAGRGYILSIGRQMNGCFASAWYDACAVMLRRLLEISIIEAYEHHAISAKIKDGDGNYVHLSTLVSQALAETSWTLSRNTKKSLPSLRDIGHMSAHGRYFHASREDIEKIRSSARIAIEEFLHLADLL